MSHRSLAGEALEQMMLRFSDNATLIDATLGLCHIGASFQSEFFTSRVAVPGRAPVG